MSPEKILDTGLKIWRDEGLDKVTLRNIATALEITHPGILYHFKTVALLKNAIASRALHLNDIKVIRQLIVTEHEVVSSMSSEDRNRYLVGR